MKLELTTPPASEPVTVAEAAFNIKGDSSYDNDKLTRDIYACRQYAETYCQCAFINQVWSMKLDRFPTVNKYNPKGAIFIPKGKVQELTDDQISYIDEDGADQTLDLDTDFHMDNVGYYSRLWPSESLGGWPTTSAYKPNAVSVDWTAGFGTTLDASQHSAIKDAILLHLGTLYEVRQSYTPIKMEEFPGYCMLLDQYRIDFNFYVNDR